MHSTDLFLPTAIIGTNSIGAIRVSYDGCYCRYSSTTGRGRYWIAICNIFNRHDEFVYYSSSSPSTRILLYHILRYILAVYSINVFAFNIVLHYQSKHCHLGYERGSSQKDQKRNGSRKESCRRVGKEE